MKKKKITKKIKHENDIEKRVEQFGKELSSIAECSGKKMEKKCQNWDTWFHKTFGIIGPLISTVFGILIFSLFVWVVGFLSNILELTILASVEQFLLTNIGAFFLLILFFSYTSYFSRSSPRIYKSISPIVTSISIVAALWVFYNVVNIANLYTVVPIISNISLFIEVNLFRLFGIFVMIGYFALLIKIIFDKPLECKPSKTVMKRSAKKVKKVKTVKPLVKRSVKSQDISRVYRSANDKILGGVCGGLGEYLGIDPVIIRLLWIISFFTWGVGIPAYIIAWIIIPRNPEHEWED